MRKWLRWGLALLALVGVAGLLWWAKELRIASLDPSQLATMSEAEQVAWLVERAMGRIERPGALRETLYEWFPRLRVKREILGDELLVLGHVCAGYGQLEPIRRLRRWALLPEEAEWLDVHGGRLQAARGEWDKALSMARQLAGRGLAGNTKVYIALAQAQVRAGQRDAARRTLLEASGHLLGNEASRHALAEAAATLGFPELAERALAPSKERRRKEKILAQMVAPAYATAQRDQDAIRVARSIRDPIWRGVAYGEIARVWTRRARWAEAMRLVQQAGGPVACARVAGYLAEQGHLAQARTLWQQAERLALNTREPLRSHLLCQIAAEYAKARLTDAARRVYDQADANVGAVVKKTAVVQIAEAYASEGKAREAIEIYRSYLAPEPAFSYKLTPIAVVLYRHGHHAQARALLQQIRADMQQEYGDWRCASEWKAVVRLLAQDRATLPLARELVDWLEAESRLVRDPQERTHIDQRLAELYAAVGDIPKAVQCAARLPDRHEQTDALMGILRAILERKEF